MTLADEYHAGASLKDMAARHGMSRQAVREHLVKAGVVMRPARRRTKPPHPAASRIVRDLAAVLDGTNQARLLRAAGVSEQFWREARRGVSNPSIGRLEVIAEAAGYELVLRRRMA